MKCEEVVAFLDPLADDELPADTTVVVMNHIKGCTTCEQEWTYRFFLRRQFQELGSSIAVPGDGLKAVDRSLERIGDGSKVRKWIAVAASAAAIGLASFTWVRMQAANALSPTVRQMVQTYDEMFVPVKTAASEPQLQALADHVRFRPGALRFEGWTLASAEVVHLPGNPVCLLRMVFRSSFDGGQQTLLSYQACQGDVDVRGLAIRTVNGRAMHCGRSNGLSLVHWTSYGRDHMLISSIPEERLISLALGV